MVAESSCADHEACRQTAVECHADSSHVYQACGVYKLVSIDRSALKEGEKSKCRVDGLRLGKKESDCVVECGEARVSFNGLLQQ